MQAAQPSNHRLELRRLDAQLDRIDDILYVDFEQARMLAQRAQVSAARLNAPAQLARALNHEAWVLVNQREFDAAVEKALTALDHARSAQRVEIEARAVNIIASSFIFTRDYANAVQLLEHQCELAQAAGDPHVLALGLHDLGVVYLVIKPYERALELFQRALTLTSPTRHRGVFVGIIEINLGVAFAKVGQVRLASQYGLRGLESFQRAGADYYTIGALNHLAYQHLIQDDYERAAAYLEQARQLAEHRDTHEQLATNLGMTAELLRRKGALSAAADMYQKAIDLAQRYQVIDNLVEYYEGLSQTLRQLGDSTAAQRFQALAQQTIDDVSFRNLDRRLMILRAIFGARRSADQAALRQLALDPAAVPQPDQGDNTLRLEQMKQTILQRLSHEFRTPLSVIRSKADLLDRYDERMSEAQRKTHYKMINDRVTWMTVMLDDILMLLKLSRGEFEPFFEMVDVWKTIQHALARLAVLKGEVSQSRVMLNLVDIPPSLPLDADLLSAIVIQLVSNALKFSDGQVILTFTLVDSHLRITVKDSGIGIPTAELRHVRGVFYRASNLDEQPGYGLGLALVERAVALWGGTWQISTEGGIGTEVEVRLPIAAAQDE